MARVLLYLMLILPLSSVGQQPRFISVEPGDSVQIQGLRGAGMRLRTAWSLNRKGNIKGGWTVQNKWLTLDEHDQLDVGTYSFDTAVFVPTFNPYFLTLNDSVRIPYRLPERDWVVYIARVEDTTRATAQPDTANILQGFIFRKYTGVGVQFDSLAFGIPAATSLPHDPQAFSPFGATQAGDTLYASFQVRGTKPSFVLDVNTGAPQWNKHLVDTLEVSPTWKRYELTFVAKYTEGGNRFDFNLGITLGEIEFRNVSLRRKPKPLPPPLPDPIDTVYIIQIDTVYLTDTITQTLRDTVTIVQRDTVEVEIFRTDTVTIRESIYLIQEINGIETKRLKITSDGRD